MTKQTSRILGRAALLVLVAVLSGCCCLSWRPGCAPKIITQPKSQTKKVGTSVTFTVVATPPPIFYQWRFNGINLTNNATNSSYTIASVGFSDVGEYSVLVWGSPTNESETAYLSVYSTAMTATGSGGTLSKPIGVFSSAVYSCDNGTFKKGYVALNDNGSIALFYGPLATPQTGIFLNNLSKPFLTVDTFHADNGIADTGLRIRKNWDTMANAACDDDTAGGTDSKQSRVDVTLSQNPGDVTHENTYRLTMLYKNKVPPPPGPPASGKVTINWSYHD